MEISGRITTLAAVRAVAVAALIGMPTGTVHAALMHTFVDTRTDTVVGSIEFSADTPGTVEAFTFSGFDGPTLDLSDLCVTANPCDQVATTWSIDDDWNLNAFTLAYDTDGFFGTSVVMVLTFDSPASDGVDQVESLTSVPPSTALQTYSSDLGQYLVARPAHDPQPVPAPGGLVMLLLALGFLAFNRGESLKP